MRTTKMLVMLIFCLGLIAGFAGVAVAAPMGTAFTYQGRLLDSNKAADGLYDFQFKLFDASVAGTQKGSTITVNELDVVDGSFIVYLDFGSDVFDGDDRWLEMGVRAGELSDPAPYTILAPRQAITATPYALQTRGLFVGEGYVLGWEPKESDRAWISVAMSADGTKQTAVVNGGQIYVSTNSGNTWTPKESNRYWQSVAMSADGTKQTAVVSRFDSTGQIYISTDSGNTWTAKGWNTYWRSVAMSADGTKQTAVVYNNGQIYISTDSGNTWTAKESNRLWYSVAMSADGAKQTAVVNGGQIYVSTDSGNTWTAKEQNRNWYSVAMSADGAKQTAVVNGGQIYVSTDSGNTWTAKESNRNWRSVAMSADGTKQTAVVYPGQIYISTDSGNTWTAKESSRNWISVAMSSDGTKRTAVVFGGQIYVAYTGFSVGIGTKNPTAELEVAGQVKITDGSQGTGKVLTSDSSGLASWQTLFTGDADWIISGNNMYSGVSGNVGIGTASPAQKLHVRGSAQFDKSGPEVGRLTLNTVTRNDPGRYGIVFANNLLAPFLGDDTQDQTFGFLTGWSNTRTYSARLQVYGRATGNWGCYIGMSHDGTDGLINTDVGDIVLSPAQNVGIGTTNPQSKLSVGGDGYSNTGVYGANTGYGGYFVAEGTSSGTGVFGLAAGPSGIGVHGYGGAYDFYATGPGTNYGTPSSIRWKRDIQPIDEALGKVMNLRGVYFNWDAEHGGGHDVGMIAEEVGKVLPEIVEYEENGIDATGMDYGKLTPLLVEAVKALKTEVDQLQKENADLRNRVEAMEKMMTGGSRLQIGVK